jgi:ABC-type transport system involved in multi-copper enzyme maturation permease subunit
MNTQPPAMPPPASGLGFFATMLEAARQGLWLLRGNRLLWAMLAVLALCGGIVFLLAGREQARLDPRDLFCLFAWWLVLGVASPWLTIYLAVQAVHGEIEDRTFQYLFLRPVSRLPLLLGKWLVVAMLGALIGVVGCAVLFAAAAAHPARWSTGVEPGLLGHFALAAVLAGFAYAAVGAAFAATFRRPLVFGSLAVVLQMVVALLPLSAGIRSVTVADPLRRLLLDRLDANSRLVELLWPTERDFRGELIGQPILSLAVFTTAVLLFAAWRYARSEYDARERE